MIVLDHRDPRPIYRQIVAKMEELALRGVLRAGEQLPSVRSLAMELSINPNTIQRAYLELENRGLVYSVPGKGSFVCDDLARVQSAGCRELGEELAVLAERAALLGLGREQFAALASSVYGKDGGDND